MKALLLLLAMSPLYAGTIQIKGKKFEVEEINQYSVITKLTHEAILSPVTDTTEDCENHETEAKSIIKKFEKYGCEEIDDINQLMCEMYIQRAKDKAFGKTVFPSRNEPNISDHLISIYRESITEEEKEILKQKYSRVLFNTASNGYDVKEAEISLTKNTVWSRLLEIAGMRLSYLYDPKSQLTRTYNFATSCVLQSVGTKFKIKAQAFHLPKVPFAPNLLANAWDDYRELKKRYSSLTKNNPLLKALMIGRDLAEFEKEKHYKDLEVKSFYDLFSRFYQYDYASNQILLKNFNKIEDLDYTFTPKEFELVNTIEFVGEVYE